MKFLHSGFEDDGGVKSERGPAPTNCGQDHTAGDNTSEISDHISDHTSGERTSVISTSVDQLTYLK